jgi:high-affinity K+ transport system ATPase subunit B
MLAVICGTKVYLSFSFLVEMRRAAMPRNHGALLMSSISVVSGCVGPCLVSKTGRTVGVEGDFHTVFLKTGFLASFGS